MTLTPEQQKALQAIATTSVKVSSSLGIPLDQVEEFQKNILQFIQNNHSLYADKVLYFVLVNDAPSAKTITQTVVTQSVLGKQALLQVDRKLRLFTTAPSPNTLTDFASILAQGNQFGIHVSKGSYCIELLKGLPIHEFDALNGQINTPFTGSIVPRPMASFRQLLDEHKKNRINKEAGVTYWYNKSKRMLRSDSKYGTEWIFQYDLNWWLNNFLSDKLDVIAEPSGHGQDKHDIRVITTDGKRYVIEIKWLGKNEANTTYSQPRINEGLQQVKIYLNNDSNLICGYLVVYDGRDQVKHEKESSWDAQFRHDLCEEPEIIFLESESPSNAAERIVKEAKS